MDYFDCVNLYPNYVVLEKTDCCYKSTGNAAYVLNDLLDYPLVTGKYGHVAAMGENLSEIKAALSTNKINFIIMEDGEIKEKKFFEDSRYSPYSIANFIKNNVQKTIQYSRTSAQKPKAENTMLSQLSLKIKYLEGMTVAHKNEKLGKGIILKAYLSEKGEIYTDIKFEGNEEAKPFIFIYCTANGIINLPDDKLLNEINELYKKSR